MPRTKRTRRRKALHQTRSGMLQVRHKAVERTEECDPACTSSTISVVPRPAKGRASKEVPRPAADGV